MEVEAGFSDSDYLRGVREEKKLSFKFCPGVVAEMVFYFPRINGNGSKDCWEALGNFYRSEARFEASADGDNVTDLARVGRFNDIGGGTEHVQVGVSIGEKMFYGK